MRCYLLAVAVGSAIDQDTNNITLFSLIEQAQVTSDEPGPSPFEVHAYWEAEPGERGVAHEMRFVLRSGAREVVSNVQPMTPTTPRLRVRSQGLPIPGTGEFGVTVQWRVAGQQDWHDGGQRWPLIIEVLPTLSTAS